MKRTSTLKRGVWKRKPKSVKKVDFNKVIRTKLPEIATVRNKADKLLTPLIILMCPLCSLCNNPTQVAHHHVHKSKSTRLRYEIDNLIPLCHKCHRKLHHNESFWASKIVEQRGIEWFRKISKIGEEIVKADVHFYIGHHARLKALIEELDD